MPMGRAKLCEPWFLVCVLVCCGWVLCSPAFAQSPTGDRANIDQGQRIVVIGPSAAGKTTLCKALREALGIPHIDIGNLLRLDGMRDSDSGRQIRTIMERGELVPDQIVCDVLCRRLRAPDCVKGFILDGFPRTLAQAEQLDHELAAQRQNLSRAVLLQVSADNLQRRRLLKLRVDDSDELAETRLAVYAREIEPILEYYRQRRLLLTINADQRIHDVLMDTLQDLFSNP